VRALASSRLPQLWHPIDLHLSHRLYPSSSLRPSFSLHPLRILFVQQVTRWSMTAQSHIMETSQRELSAILEGSDEVDLVEETQCPSNKETQSVPETQLQDQHAIPEMDVEFHIEPVVPDQPTAPQAVESVSHTASSRDLDVDLVNIDMTLQYNRPVSSGKSPAADFKFSKAEKPKMSFARPQPKVQMSTLTRDKANQVEAIPGECALRTLFLGFTDYAALASGNSHERRLASPLVVSHALTESLTPTKFSMVPPSRLLALKGTTESSQQVSQSSKDASVHIAHPKAAVNEQHQAERENKAPGEGVNEHFTRDSAIRYANAIFIPLSDVRPCVEYC
jgi:hypothetical protein